MRVHDLLPAVLLGLALSACSGARLGATAPALAENPDTQPIILQFSPGEQPWGANRFIGLSHGDSSQSYDDIDYAVYLYAGNDGATPQVYIVEGGVFRFWAGAFAAGDVFRIVVDGGTVRYVKNDAVLYTSSVAPVLPLSVDTAFFGCAPEVVKDIRMTDALGALSPVTSWINAQGVIATGNDLATTLTPACSWGAHGVASAPPAADGMLAGDGVLELRSGEATGNKFIGLGHDDGDLGYADIDHAIYFYGSGGVVYVVENGAFVAYGGAFSPSDTFAIRVTGGVVSYARNGVTFYTSPRAPTLPLYVDSAFYGCAAAEIVTDIVLSEDGGAPRPITSWRNTSGMTSDGNTLAATSVPACTWGAHGTSSRPLTNDTAGGPAGDRRTWSCSSVHGAYCSDSRLAPPLANAESVKPFLDAAALNWGCTAAQFGAAVVVVPDGFSRWYGVLQSGDVCGTAYWNASLQAAYFVPAGAIGAKYAAAAATLGLPRSNPIGDGEVTLQIFENGIITHRQADAVAYAAAGSAPEVRAVVAGYLRDLRGAPLTRDLSTMGTPPTGVSLEVDDPRWDLPSRVMARTGWTSGYVVSGPRAQLWNTDLGYPLGDLQTIGTAPDGQAIQQQQFERGYLVWQPKGCPATPRSCPSAGSPYCTTYGSQSSNYAVAAYNAGTVPRLAFHTDTSMYCAPVTPACDAAAQPVSVYTALPGYATTRGRYTCSRPDGFPDGLALDLITADGVDSRIDLEPGQLERWIGVASVDGRLGGAGETPGSFGLPEPTIVSSELSMAGAGRLRRAPYGFVYFAAFDPPVGSRNVWIRARCLGKDAPRDRCDPALVAFRYQGDVLQQIHDDHNADEVVTADLTRGAPQDSTLRIALPAGAGQQRIYVAAYSAIRGTSRIRLNWNSCASGANCVAMWPPIGATSAFTEVYGGETVSTQDIVVGGTMVDLGFPRAGDTFEVATEGNVGELNARRWIFNAEQNVVAHTLFPGVNFPFNFTGWEGGGHTYALVGESLSGHGTAAERRADFILSPNRQEIVQEALFAQGGCSVPYPSATRIDCTDFRPHLLPGGSYEFSAEVRLTDGAIGDTSASDNVAPPSRYWDTYTASWQNLVQCRSGDHTVKRGQGNDLAFKMVLVVDGQEVKTRLVPRGALGSKLPFVNRVTLRYAQPVDGSDHDFRLAFKRVGGGLDFNSVYTVTVNPDAVPFTAVTQNLEYRDEGDEHDDDDFQREEDLTNVAGLLGGSSDALVGPNLFDWILRDEDNVPIPADDREIRFRNNRGPFNFDADLIVGEEFTPGRAPFMHGRLETLSRDSWQLAAFIGATNVFWSPDRYSPVFARSSIKNHAGILMGAQSGPDSFIATGGPEDYIASGGAHCGLDICDLDYWTHAESIAARRILPGGSVEETPIVVYPLYLPSNNDDDLPNRADGITNLEGVIIDDMDAHPERFHRGTSTNPRDLGTRIIILGDSNMLNHNCAEVNRYLKQLRDRFGYAIDVSQASVDYFKKTNDMYYNGQPLDDPLSGIIDTLTGRAWYWVHGKTWETLPNKFGIFLDPNMNVGSFSWWARTNTVLGSSEARLDIVLLVGLGWADDDPVVSYRVPPTEDEATPMNNFRKGGVDIRRYCDREAERVGNGTGTNYKPYMENDAICGHDSGHDTWLLAGALTTVETNKSGAFAYSTDHAPLAVKVRTLGRR